MGDAGSFDGGDRLRQLVQPVGPNCQIDEIDGRRRQRSDVDRRRMLVVLGRRCEGMFIRRALIVQPHCGMIRRRQHPVRQQCVRLVVRQFPRAL